MGIIISGIGRIGKDAVTRQAGSDSVTGFSLAMDNGFGDKKQTLWFDCSGWGKRYSAVAEYLLKGGQVFVSGELCEREHEGKKYLTIRLNDLGLIGSKPAGDRPARSAQPATAGTDGEPFPDEDIPF